MKADNTWQWVAFLREECVRSAARRAEPTPVREGRIIAHFLVHMPIALPPDAAFAGVFGPGTAEAGLWERHERWTSERGRASRRPCCGPAGRLGAVG